MATLFDRCRLHLLALKINESRPQALTEPANLQSRNSWIRRIADSVGVP